MSVTWVPWDGRGQAQKRTGAHRLTGTFGKKSRVAYRYCVQCGIVNLRNDATRKALRKPCVWEE